MYIYIYIYIYYTLKVFYKVEIVSIKFVQIFLFNSYPVNQESEMLRIAAIDHKQLFLPVLVDNVE